MREETREIYLTAEEYFLLDLERLPFGELEDTPIMDKIRKEGIEPLSFTLKIRLDERGEGVYVSDRVIVYSLPERIISKIKRLLKRITLHSK
jgi:hypothetical protein